MTIELINNTQSEVEYTSRYENVPEHITKAVKTLLDGCWSHKERIIYSETERRKGYSSAKYFNLYR